MALIDCPAPNCDVKHQEEDLWAQKEHMDGCHPEIIAQRLTDAGFRQDPRTGRWIDCWSSD